LLQDRPQLQTLHGVGEPIGAATLVRKGAEDWGLLIRRTPQGGPDDLVFDLTNRQFAPSPAGWGEASSASDDWQTVLKPPYRARPLSPWYLWIYERGNVVGPGIPILPERESAGKEDVQVTAYALLPPGRGPGRVAVPIAAIAASEPMVGPTLVLYNGKSGERV